MIYLAVVLGLLLLGFLAGGAAERGHFKRLDAAEAELRGVLVTDLQSLPGADPAAGAAMVTGEVVIANDYFKMFTAGLVNIFGGKVKAYESLMERARRDALVKMQQDAVAKGYDAVACFRIEMSRVSVQTFSVVAWGTGYRRA